MKWRVWAGLLLRVTVRSLYVAGVHAGARTEVHESAEGTRRDAQGVEQSASVQGGQEVRGAVDLVSTPSDAPAIAQAVAAPMVDAANRWAAEGLRGLF